MSRNYKFADPEGLYFVSFATVYWIDVFVRRLYFDCIVDNLNYCVAEKGMEIFAWVIMPSHMHLVFRSLKNRPEDLLGGFKSVTSRKMVKLIEENMQESRRESMLMRSGKQVPPTPTILTFSFCSSIITRSNFGVCRSLIKRLTTHIKIRWWQGLLKIAMNIYTAARGIIAGLKDWLKWWLINCCRKPSGLWKVDNEPSRVLISTWLACTAITLHAGHKPGGLRQQGGMPLFQQIGRQKVRL
jgi:REP element-mobilizing transposase RayT